MLETSATAGTPMILYRLSFMGALNCFEMKMRKSDVD